MSTMTPATRQSPAEGEPGVEEIRRALSGLDAGAQFRYLRDRCGGRVIASSSFGAQASVLLHVLKQNAPEIPVVFIDTGYLFPETYQFAESLMHHWELDVRVYTPRMTAARLEALHGSLWEQGEVGQKKYGLLSKVEPMDRALKEIGADIWVSGIRSSQAQSRRDRPSVEQQGRTIKVYPLIDWSDDDVAAYVERHELPVHPLVAQGYVSIGDRHSTRPLEPGMRREDTRFNGEQTECGLHLPSNQLDYQI